MAILSSILKGFMEKATWTKAVIALTCSQTLYFVMLFATIPAVEKKAGGMKLFDLMSSGYTPKYAAQFLNAAGEEGRRLYLTHQLPLDFVYPALMAITGALFISLFSRKTDRRFGVLLFVPVCGAIFDYLENVSVTTLLFAYPHVPTTVVRLASLFTISKSIFVTVYFIVLGALFILFLYTIIREKTGRGSDPSIPG
ncbi:hypothetical protein [Gorillibacterium massiliense]|uniref:hypothetical protein n=1 Tax=Gorillibacterium massiliense TaxID=1280390 RepID=UPI0004AFD482|nr:hypothetical protein [Gorillibacterium massiliense]